MGLHVNLFGYTTRDFALLSISALYLPLLLLVALLDETVAVVSVMAVNNETGVIHPIAEIAERVKAVGGLLLVDCAQSAGKLPLPDADFIVADATALGRALYLAGEILDTAPRAVLALNMVDEARAQLLEEFEVGGRHRKRAQGARSAQHDKTGSVRPRCHRAPPRR